MKNFNLLISTSILFLLIIIHSSSLFSQKEHKIMLSGYFNGSVTSPGNASNKWLNLNTDLQAGYFFTEKIAVGAKLPFNYQASNIIDPFTYTSRIGLLPFIQIHPFKQKGPIDWFFWIETGLYLVNQADFQQTGPTPFDRSVVRSRRTDWSIGGGIGLNYFLTKNIALSTTIKLENTQVINGESFYEHPDFDLKFGIMILLDKKKTDD